MIRDAVVEDIPALVKMGRRFFDASGMGAVSEYDPGSFAAMARHLMDSPDGILVVPETLSGMAGAIVYPFYFNAHHKAAQEMFWWVDPDARGEVSHQLRRGLEQRARDAGARSMTMIALDALKPETMARLYRQMGYKAIEHSFIKVI